MILFCPLRHQTPTSGPNLEVKKPPLRAAYPVEYSQIGLGLIDKRHQSRKSGINLAMSSYEMKTSNKSHFPLLFSRNVDGDINTVSKSE